MEGSSQVTTPAEQRRQQLEAELAAIQQEEQAQAEQERQRQHTMQEAQLDPEQRAQRTEIEKRAHQALDREYPDAWLPQKNGNSHPTEIVGLVLRIDPRVGPSKTWGTYSAVVEVRATSGQEWTVWANEGGAMYAQLVRLRVQPGEVIAVRYRGKKESAQNPGQSYHDFRLVRVEDEEGPAAPVDYDQLQRTTEPAALPEGDQAPKPDDDIPF
jgi:hypothetical protein